MSVSVGPLAPGDAIALSLLPAQPGRKPAAAITTAPRAATVSMSLREKWFSAAVSEINSFIFIKPISLFHSAIARVDASTPLPDGRSDRLLTCDESHTSSVNNVMARADGK
jgi:nucleoid-associated protein YgaU